MAGTALVTVGLVFAAAIPAPRAVATTCNLATVRAGTRWRGTYTCGQGLTELTLVIRSVRDGRVDAIFDFDWRAGGISRRFEVRGVLSPTTCRLRLTPVRWLEQPPPGWVMVSLDGAFGNNGTRYSGRVHPDSGGAACTTFSVTLER